MRSRQHIVLEGRGALCAPQLLECKLLSAAVPPHEADIMEQPSIGLHSRRAGHAQTETSLQLLIKLCMRKAAALLCEAGGKAARL